MSRNIDLFYVNSITTRFPHYGNYYSGINIAWFFEDDRHNNPPIPYEQAIKDYSPDIERKGLFDVGVRVIEEIDITDAQVVSDP